MYNRKSSIDYVHGENATYIFSPRASIIRNIHECASIIETLANGTGPEKPLADSAIGELGDYLLIVNDDSSRRLYSYRISPEVIFLLTLFTSTRTLAESQAIFSNLTNGTLLPITALEELIELQALIPVSYQEQVAFNQTGPMLADTAA